MKFGASKAEVDSQPSRGGGGGFIKYPKAGENQLRIVDEPEKWVYYWEHFNPDGYSFPCDSENREKCHGCTSDNEKMKKASQKVAFNAVSSYKDELRMDVWKVPRTAVADKLEARAQRNGTITDRDFLITQRKSNGKIEYDVEGLDKEKMDFSPYEEYQRDPEELLAQAYDEAWGSGGDAKPNSNLGGAVKEKVEKPPAWVEDEAPKKPRIQRDEPKEEKVVTEAELRKMDVFDLAKLCEDEGFGKIPAGKDTVDDIVDWMISA